MKFGFMVVLLPWLVFSQTSSNIGETLNADLPALISDNIQQHLKEQASNFLPASVMEGASDRQMQQSQYASHMIRWGLAKLGCTYPLPRITISCGTGGKIALVAKDSTVQSCVPQNNNNQLLCTPGPNPGNPGVTVQCSGTTPASLTATARIANSQATACNEVVGIFPQINAIVRYGAASVFILLARYCKSGNTLTLNSNYPCTTGTFSNSNGYPFCVSQGNCTRRINCTTTSTPDRCPGSCNVAVPPVVVTDTDNRANCSNQGPKATRTPASLHAVTWTASSSKCSSFSSNQVTVTCSNGGRIVWAGRSSAVTGCTQPNQNTLVCNKNVTTATGSISAWCYGTSTQLTAVASLPGTRATGCNASNIAFQGLIMQRFCGNLTAVRGYPSSSCTNPAQLRPQASGVPICLSSKTCTGTRCTISVDAVSMSDPNVDPTCILVGPQS